MKIVTEENAEKFKYADTSSVLEYSIALNEKNMVFASIQLQEDILWKDILLI